MKPVPQGHFPVWVGVRETAAGGNRAAFFGHTSRRNKGIVFIIKKET